MSCVGDVAMEVYFGYRMRSLSYLVLLLCCGLGLLGCEALLGAEFDELQEPRDADAAWASDGSSHAEASDDRGAPDREDDEGSPPPADPPVGSCTPGEVKVIAGCANCGRYLQICSEQKTWEPPYCEKAPGACAPGSTEMRPCEEDGTQKALCTPSCTWMLDECTHTVCMPNEIEKQPCGSCGTQSRTCVLADGGWRWAPFSSCMDEKSCAPSQVDRESCGRCGTRTRACDNQCSWGSWGGCQNEGECSPGDAEERVCIVGLLKQTRTCGDRCAWGEWLGLCL
jgi:hypothetical protein